MRNIYILVVSIITINLNAQVSNFVPQVFQGNPEVSALQKFKETEVSLNTGVPNISIPFHTINIDGIQIPIGLSYHSVGFRVNEIATPYGLGWSMSANSSVNRIIKTRPDDSFNGYIFTDKKVENIQNSVITSNITLNKLDLEPDVFNVNLPSGKSLEFMFKQNLADNRQNIICFPLSDVKIKVNYNGYTIESFEITDIDGTKYFFGGNNKFDNATSSTFEWNPEESSLPAEIPNSGVTGTNTWHLNYILTKNNKNIQYNYRDEFYYMDNNCEHSTQNITYEYVPTKSLVSSKSYYLSGKLGVNRILISIITPNERIEFIEGTNRLDLPYSKKIEKIRIFDYTTTKVNEIDFLQTYFQSPSTHLYLGIGCGTGVNLEAISKRLKLDAILIKEKNTLVNQNFKYEFEYNTEVILPHRNSFAQDYWGFYNGANNNQDLIPNVFFNVKAELNQTEGENFTLGVNYNNTNRLINPNYTQACILKKITYPESGYTQFEYENNTIPADNYIDKYITDVNDKEEVFLSTLVTQGGDLGNGNSVPAQLPIIQLNFEDYYLFTKSFTIDSRFINEYGIHFESFSSICDPNDEFGQNIDCSRFNIEKISVPEDVFTLNKSVGITGSVYKDAYFTTGNYMLKMMVKKSEWDSYPSNNKPNIWVKLNFLKRILDNERFFGGLRIKSIKNYNYDNALIKERIYSYKDTTNISSGRYNQFPIFKDVKLANYLFYSNVECLTHPAGRVILYSPITDGFTIKFSSNSYAPLINSGNNLIYTKVKETVKNVITSETKEFVSTFSFVTQNINSHPNKPYSKLWKNGNLLHKESINQSETLEYAYNKNGIVRGYDLNYLNFPCNPRLIDHCIDGHQNRYVLWSEYISTTPKYELETDNHFTSKMITKTDNVENIIENQYLSPSHLQQTNSISTNSLDETIETIYSYPQDPIMSGQPHVLDLVAKNMISAPLRTQTIKNGEILSEQLTVFEKDASTSDLVLPKFIFARKVSNANYTQTSNGNADRKITFDLYDNKGNINQYTLENNIPVSIVWSYNKTQPVAKIENMAYSAIPPNLITAIESATTETALETALNALRNNTQLANAMVTTYTYKPLIGVSTITDPKGDKITYHYDSFNRLKEVRDKDGKLLSENEYHYRTQN